MRSSQHLHLQHSTGQVIQITVLLGLTVLLSGNVQAPDKEYSRTFAHYFVTFWLVLTKDQNRTMDFGIFSYGPTQLRIFAFYAIIKLIKRFLRVDDYSQEAELLFTLQHNQRPHHITIHDWNVIHSFPKDFRPINATSSAQFGHIVYEHMSPDLAFNMSIQWTQ